jgi:hypothetical protein
MALHPTVARVLEAAVIAGLTKTVQDGIDKAKKIAQPSAELIERLDGVESRLDALETSKRKKGSKS